MKKILAVFLLGCCLASLLATQAAARDLAYVSAEFTSVTKKSSTSHSIYTHCFGEGIESFVVSSSSQVSLDLTFSFPSESLYSTYISTVYITFYNLVNGTPCYPTSVILNRGLSDEQEYPIDSYQDVMIGSNQIANFDCSVNNVPDTLLYNWYTKVLGIDLFLDPYEPDLTNGLQSISFIFDSTSLLTNDSSRVYGNSPVTIEIPEQDTSSIVDSLKTLNRTNSSGFVGTATALQANSAAISASLNEQTQSMTATLDQVKEAVDQMKEGQKDALKGALDEFFEELKQEAQDTANATVEEIKEKFDIDISAYSNSMNMLYNSVSTHSMDANMTFPAGKVTLMGQEMVFWQESEIDFNSVFDNDYVQLLLIPFRFVIFFGFGAYLLNWIKKLENMITMNSSEG